MLSQMEGEGTTVLGYFFLTLRIAADKPNKPSPVHRMNCLRADFFQWPPVVVQEKKKTHMEPKMHFSHRAQYRNVLY